MKSALGIAQKLCLFVAPIAATSTFVAAPSQAGTFARSESAVFVTNFSHTPDRFSTFSDTQTEAISGSVLAEAEAEANFVPEIGDNFVWTEAGGDGSDYQGNAFGVASIVGFFSIDRQETFSFDFLTLTSLESAIDDVSFETASAFGQIQFELFDHTSGNLLDSFGVVGQVDLPAGEAGIEFAANPNVSVIPFQESSSQPKSGFATAAFAGRYARPFGSSIQLKLVETKTNRASIAAKPVPEPSEIAGTIAMGLLLGYWRLKSNRSRRAN